MTHDDDDRPRLAPDDARFVERLSKAWTPPELGAAQRTRFDARLAERTLGRRRRVRALGLAVAGCALALAAVLVARVRMAGDAGQVQPEAAPTVATAPGAAAATPEETLLALADGPEDGDEANGAEALPDDYQAIASLLF